MYRFLLDELKAWAKGEDHKPLVLRGARQVGKSFLVRLFAGDAFERLAEINFEQTPDIAELFKSRQPRRIIPLLETRLNLSIVPGKTLLFLDEIQAAPEVFAALRYFYEQMPQLHVVAAGSLLEFVLEDHEFSMPVGRTEYMHLGPMVFEEFLLALGQDKLLEYVQHYSLSESIPESIHQELMHYVKDFFIVGGMPQAVAAFSNTRSYLETERISSGILSTYRDDFSKYGQRVNSRRIERVFSRLPLLVGQKLKYTQIDKEEKSRDIKHALHLLELARIAYRVLHTGANGLPLGAEANDKHFKAIFLDVGLICRACGLSMADMQNADDIMMVNSGAVCEQFVGQHLLYAGRSFETPQIFCWMRHGTSANAEVDYLLTHGTHIIPVEVKAGKAGTLKSVHVFVNDKKCRFAIRFYAGLPAIADLETSVAGAKPHPFRLLSLPFYLINQTKRLCREVIS